MPAADKPAEKESLHPRNLHRAGYDFAALVKASPALADFVRPNPAGVESINFADPDAVKELNSALLKSYYGLSYWDIPDGYLCPPIPGRADYIHYLADLLAEGNGGNIPTGKSIRVLDVGVGANCVYPIIGHSAYGWQFTGTDTDAEAIRSANKIVSNNPTLSGAIKIRPQSNKANVFKGAITQGELYDITMCNPPFHASAQEAQAGTLKKLQNLNNGRPQKAQLNFGGKNAELWYPGGEIGFIRYMAEQSLLFADKVLWFTTLVSKKDSLAAVYRALSKVKALEVKTIEMHQGQKVSRVVAWTFLSEPAQRTWRNANWKTGIQKI
ncbi:23S rRNA (adenine(1618)-N(6))-methyltransferase RlmF [Mucilaginibacter pedocola]|uniref:Ribosomal RNA large subunit methyltransferase F n=1 Tax=Mucilaginibacter pedocola TaxID=1792845 RepID=A0A1S9PHU8_9SPHI|nr:23S rRNA (adenine(1618)-N(6))-methyltransferase RlmF [Mucilaginibacter pedocola]OOQ60533.1 23S rRNA (adenine(1618)-N(6))-methyltransferase [Mucilaginibacter pedocola]